MNCLPGCLGTCENCTCDAAEQPSVANQNGTVDGSNDVSPQSMSSSDADYLFVRFQNLLQLMLPRLYGVILMVNRLYTV